MAYLQVPSGKDRDALLVAEVVTRSENETLAFAEAFGRLLEPGDVVVLQGGLGAGKTVFARGVAAGLGCDPDEVQSPTFTIAREYRDGRFPLFHLDIYRLENPAAELEAIGFEVYFEPREGASLVEWGERAGGLLPAKRLEVSIESLARGRRIAVRALGLPGRRVQDMRARLATFGGGGERERAEES